MGNALRFGLRLCGHLPGAGGPGAERQPLRPCFQCGGALARGADPAAGPWNGPAGAGSCAGSAPPGDLPLRRISCGPSGPVGPLGVRLAGGTALVRYGLCGPHLPLAGGAVLAGVPLEAPSAGRSARPAADGGGRHRGRKRPQPGHPPGGAGGDQKRPGGGHFPERPGGCALPRRQNDPERRGDYAGPAECPHRGSLS